VFQASLSLLTLAKGFKIWQLALLVWESKPQRKIHQCYLKANSVTGSTGCRPFIQGCLVSFITQGNSAEGALMVAQSDSLTHWYLKLMLECNNSCPIDAITAGPIALQYYATE
jgi:hypothetical protein